ncbi:MAG: M23 family metallopeptidase [Cyanobacteriota bacterium]|nr:M23 family metallopeptidase [Cyanobacteriota bacterium]
MEKMQYARAIFRSWKKWKSWAVVGSIGMLGCWVWQPQLVRSAAPEDNSTQIGAAWSGASFPVEDFIDYTSPFGYRRSATGGSSTEFHSGLDMAAPEGSYIRSWWAGQVVEVIDDGRCGVGLVIQSGNWEHIYCHMSGTSATRDGQRYFVDREGGIVIAEGQPITTAARIGRVGMTGRTTGPHLHWGLRFNGEWIDPALVLRAMYEDQAYSSK